MDNNDHLFFLVMLNMNVTHVPLSQLYAIRKSWNCNEAHQHCFREQKNLKNYVVKPLTIRSKKILTNASYLKYLNLNCYILVPKEDRGKKVVLGDK